MNTTTFAKATSTTGTVHLLLEGSNTVTACATGGVKPRVAPVLAGTDPALTCKRCIRVQENARAAARAEAADTSEIDALLAEVASTNELGGELVDALLAEATEGTRPRDLDQSDVEADAQRMEDELAGQPDEAAIQAHNERTPEEQEADADAAAEAQAAQPTAAPTQRKRLDQRALVLAYLEAHPGEAFTPHALSKALTPEGWKRLGLRDVCARLAAKGEIEAVEGEKAATYRLPELPEDATA